MSDSIVTVEAINSSSYDDFLTILRFRYKNYIDKLCYFCPSIEQKYLRMEFDKYDGDAIHIYAKKDKEILSTARLIISNHGNLPMLSKVHVLNYVSINNKRAVEISRLIVDNHSGIILAKMIDKIFNVLMSLNCEIILIDVFEGSNCHKIFQKIGFVDTGYYYKDEEYNIDTKSTVLHLDFLSFRESLYVNPNKKQQYFLKVITSARGATQ